MSNGVRYLVLLNGLLFGFSCLAVSPYKTSLFSKARNSKSGNYITDGVVLGGQISDGFTLLDVRRGLSKKSKMERVVLDIGDLVGEPAKNEVAYHQVNVDRKRSRLIIELNQVARSGINEEELKKVFKPSALVKTAELNFDPEDLTTSLVLHLKKETKVEVFNLVSPKVPSRIVIDMVAAKVKKTKI